MSFKLRRAGGILQPNDPVFAIILSQIIAFGLTLYPFPQAYAAWRPEWLYLTTFYWVSRRADWSGIWFSFFMGLAADFLVGTLLGQHAINFVVMTALIRAAQLNKTINWSLLSLFLLLIGIFPIYWGGMALVDLITGVHPPVVGWEALMSSLVVWPIVYTILNMHLKKAI